MKRLHLRSLRTKHWLIIGAAVIIGIIAALIVASILLWQQFDAKFATNSATLTSDAQALLAKDPLTLGDIRDYRSKLTTVSTDLCRDSLLVRGYRQVVASAQERYRACEQRQQQATALTDTTQKLEDQLAFDSKVADILTSAQKDLAVLDPQAYTEASKRWQTARSALETAATTDVHKQALQPTITATTDIAKAYDALASASEAKKRPDYDTAMTSLRTSYDALKASSATLAKASEAPSAEFVQQLTSLATP